MEVIGGEQRGSRFIKGAVRAYIYLKALSDCEIPPQTNLRAMNSTVSRDAVVAARTAASCIAVEQMEHNLDI